MDTEWKRCGCMSIVEFGKLKQNNPEIEFRVKYKGQFVECGWIGFFYKAVADPHLFVRLYAVDKGGPHAGASALVAVVDKMIPSIFVYKRSDKSPTRKEKKMSEGNKNIEGINLTNKNIADLMRSVRGDEAESIRSELKESLRVGMEILAEIIDQWNDVCADGDRGRRNDALGLIIYDDGSGRVVTYTSLVGEDFLNNQIEFEDIAEGVERLADWF